MKTLFLLFLFCHVSSPVKHSLKFLFTTSHGIQNLPQSMGVILVDDIQASYCDSNKTLEIKQDVWKRLFKDNPQILEQFTEECFKIIPISHKSRLDRIMQNLNQSGAVHILQLMEGCKSDEQTGETVFEQYGYDGEDFMSFDLKKRTWISRRPEADVIKREWNTDKDRIENNIHILTQNHPEWLKLAVKYGESILLRTVRPSVSLLQTSPSSPVSCHATGFYPDRATMFWRWDGQELHEDVDHGEILPNQDGTFQMTVDLNISSVKPEDWTRYDCVFQLYGAETKTNKIITKLDKTVIRTNSVPPSEFPVGSVVGVVVGLMLLSVCITGLFIWRKKKKNNGFSRANIGSYLI